MGSEFRPALWTAGKPEVSHSREHSSKVNIGTFKVKPNGKPEVRCLITFFMDKVNSSMEILSSMDLSSQDQARKTGSSILSSPGWLYL